MNPISSPLKNFSILAAGETASKIMGGITTIYLARVLGTESYGLIGFTMALYGYFALFSNPGFEIVGTREIAKGKMSPGTIISSMFFVRSALAAAAFCVLIAVALVSPFSSTVRTLVLIQGCNLLLVPFMFQFFFRGTKDMSSVAYSRIVQSVSYLALIFLLVASEADLVRVPMIFLASTMVGLLPLNVRILREFPLRSFRIDSAAIRQIGQQVLHVGAASILIQIYVSFDTIMLGYMRTPQEVGIYTAAYKIITFLTLIPGLVFQTYLPDLSKTTAGGPNAPVLKRYQMILGAAGIVAGVLGIPFARLIMVTIFGAPFAPGVLPLQILLCTTTVIYFNIAVANPLLAWGREKEYLLIVGTGACVNILLNIAFIPSYGMTGAAVATLSAEAAVFCMALFRRYKLRTEHPGLAAG